MGGRSPQTTLTPEVLRWARERANLAPDALAAKMKVKLESVLEWERTGKISMLQAEKLARNTHTPLGLLYLQKPPEDKLPISDFRASRGQSLQRPSPNLLETVYTMQRRQAWMRDEMIENGCDPVTFVGNGALKGASPRKVADAIYRTLNLERDWAASEKSWEGAQRFLQDKIEDAGILIFLSGIIENNTHRKLDPDEFQGFALIDEYAPLIFINSADFKAAQMFTIAHELAHLFIGKEGISRFSDMRPTDNDVERRCDKIAAEFLVPESELLGFWEEIKQHSNPYGMIARRFKVSSWVAARRALDLGLIKKEKFFEFYNEQKENERQKRREVKGGSFWNTQNTRIGHRFGLAVISAAAAGRLLYRDAYALTGLRGGTFDQFVEKMRGKQ